MEIFLKTLVGKTVMVRLPPNSTVLDVKRKFQDQEGVPACSQRLIFGGNQLKDGQTLRDCNVDSGSTLHVVLGLRKPVILLYPSAPLDAAVAVQLAPLWSFSSLYPKPPPIKLHHGSSDSEVCR